MLLPAFVSLGLWQWRKADGKSALQAELDLRSGEPPVAMPTAAVDTESLRESLRFRRVILRGRFDAARQTLIDNRVHQGQAGYHVVTPFQLEGSAMHVLVNRGWTPAAADRRQLPAVAVPDEALVLTGVVVIPGQRFFNLAPQPTSGWTPVWQNLDLERFQQALPYPVQPLVVQLDADSPGGLVRDWPRPDDRTDHHRSYALQWFGFAAASLGIWGYFLVRRP